MKRKIHTAASVWRQSLGSLRAVMAAAAFRICLTLHCLLKATRFYIFHFEI